MTEYNAYEQSFTELSPQKVIKTWKWDSNPFFNTGNYKQAFVPSYFDAPMPDKSFVASGPIGSGLKVMASDSAGIVLTPGNYSLHGQSRLLAPNEAVRLLVSANDSPLPLPVSNSYTPELVMYKRINNITTVDKKYSLVLSDPGSGEFSVGDTVTLTGTVTVTVSAVISKQADTVTLVSGVHNIFMLPKFPVTGNVTITGITDFKIDRFSGVVFTPAANNVSSITITYNACPLLTYVPSFTILNDTRLPFSRVSSDEYFLVMEADNEY